MENMSAHKGLLWLTALAIIASSLLVVTGIWMTDLPRVSQVCSGVIIETELCEPARFGRMIFGSLVTASGIIAMSIIVAAILLRPRKPNENDDRED